MILFPILLAFITWLLILWLCNQHKYLNIFEQLALWFVAALSLFVFELFIWGIIFDKLSLIWPIITFILSLWLLIYKNKKQKWFIKEIIQYIKSDFVNIKTQFKWFKSRKQYLMLGILVYVLLKLFIVFSINVNMPTFDEDAVVWWDIKTKIFTENKSLVLDKNSPEYFWTDYGRYPFASIIDTYFMLPYGQYINWFGNIISPLIYILSLLLLFGIFFRKTNIFFSILTLYIFTSIPFVFIHWFGSYRNFPSWVILFIFIFYLIDQLFNIERIHWNNIKIILPLLFIGFLSSIIRNEGVMLTGIMLLAVIFLYSIFKKLEIRDIKQALFLFIPIILGFILNKIIFSFYPIGSVLNTWGNGGTKINIKLLNSFFTNIGEPGVFAAPFQQMFYHSDYSLLFLIFTIVLLVFSLNYKKMKWVWTIFAITLFLIIIFMFILYSNFQWLGLLTHYAFIRYPVSMILFLIYPILYVPYIIYESRKN